MSVTAPTAVDAGGRCPPIGIPLEGIILPPILTVYVILGLLGNVVAFWIFCWKLKSWKCTVQFLFNILIADFFVLVSLPLRVDALLRGYWVFGDGMCRINLFLMFTNRSASIGFMTVVVIYRYFKVVHPHHRFNRMTKRQAWYAVAFLWLLVIAPRVPMLAFSHIKGEGNQTQCFFFTSYGEASWAILVLVRMHRILSVLEFLVPLAMLLFCSARIFSVLKRRQMDKAQNVRRAMQACTAIVVVFAVCFLPGTVTTLGLWFIGAQRPIDCASFYAFTQLTVVSFGLTFLNSALDPIIYCFSSSMFRNALVGALPKALSGGGCCGGAGDRGEGAAVGTSCETQSTAQQELQPLPTEKATEATE
uniref:Hydroxycarboxylic acid receptor 2-like n=1 Tax=Gadus morhua TaxID=8049 RepID=A0A8C5C1E3_GADMO